MPEEENWEDEDEEGLGEGRREEERMRERNHVGGRKDTREEGR